LTRLATEVLTVGAEGIANLTSDVDEGAVVDVGRKKKKEYQTLPFSFDQLNTYW
jgi:hypothetical protein